MGISLALPVYNGANYLREALESAVAQGPELAEIVVSDNCSTDATPDIVAEFVRRDSRVRHERSSVLLNQADNVTRAVCLCRQEWVQIFCHDDLIRPGAIAALEQILDSVSPTCALVAHQPCHLFANGHTHRRVNGVSRVETRDFLMGVSVIEESAEKNEYKPDVLLASSLRNGGVPYFPALTTAAVRRWVFEALGGFEPRWVHFDTFLWIKLARDHGYAVSSGHWTLTRVHSQQVAVKSRKNQRSYRDFRDFFASFIPEARLRYTLGFWACFKLNLKPVSQASAPLVVALFKRTYREFFSQWLSLPWWIWPQVLLLTGINLFRERRRNAELWRKVPPTLTYE